LHVWRLTRRRFRKLDGEGARHAGGRWNNAGRPVIYTSSTLSLAALEYLVHMDIEDAPGDLIAMRIGVPDDVPTQEVAADGLPDGWRREPRHPACIEIGERWLAEGRTLALRVPSAVIPEEANWLINPAHPDARRVPILSVGDFAFDPRLR
jgi:RES domain-containing protein